MKRFEFRFKRYRRQAIIDLTPVVAITFFGKESPTLPLFLALTLFNRWEAGIEKEYYIDDDDSVTFDRWYRLYYYKPNIKTGINVYFPRKKN